MEFAARDPWKRLDDIERRDRVLLAERLDAVADLVARWPEDAGVPDLASELAHQYGCSHHEASEWVRMATALRDLPALRRAVADGRLSRGQLRWVTRFATAETDDAWAERAPGMSPSELRQEARRQARITRQQAEDQHATRRAEMFVDGQTGSLHVEADLPGEQGAAFADAVHRAARDIEPDPGADDPSAARLADALMSLVTSSGGRPGRPTLVVHTDLETLTGTHDGTRHLGETASGIQLHAGTIRRIGCMAKVRVAVERKGQLVGLVSASRGPTEAQLEALWFRDRHCTFPGCEARRFVEPHHIRHWSDGGPTTMENLTLLCGRHHRMLHEGEWTIRGRPPDGLEFVDRWGGVRTREVPELPRAG